MKKQLLLGSIIVFIGAGLFGMLEVHNGNMVLGGWSKFLGTLQFTLVLLLLGPRLEGKHKSAITLLGISLALCSLGEWFMSLSADAFIPGLACFFVSYALIAGNLVYHAPRGGRRKVFPLLVLTSAASVGFFIFLGLGIKDQVMATIVGLYLLLQCVLAASGFVFAWQHRNNRTLLALMGCILIFFSDVVIGINVFGPGVPNDQFWIIPPYYLGLALITLGIMAMNKPATETEVAAAA